MTAKAPESFDSLIMLTWSNWFTELRSNRYHYATRFAKSKLVLFVQPDLKKAEYRLEESGVDNLYILHIYQKYDATQLKLFNQALSSLGIIKPVFWIYNSYFQNIVLNRYSACTIYHATEDYLSSDSRIKIADKKVLHSLNMILERCDLLIAVSEGVRQSYLCSSNFKGEAITITNGCDYKFYSLDVKKKRMSNSEDVAFYQGNIFDKLDYSLLIGLARRMPSWKFRFCGKVLFNEEGWKELCSLPNVEYLGLFTPEEIREAAYQSTVGIIPFVESEWIIERSFPLKTFEYLACGLPVVSVPIKSILEYNHIIEFASGINGFEEALIKAKAIRNDPDLVNSRLREAEQQDYDIKVDKVNAIIAHDLLKTKSHPVLNVAVLYEPSSIHVSTISEHLNSFARFSEHDISYLPATQGLKSPLSLACFDVVVIHYSIRVSVLQGNLMLSPSYIQELINYGGYKVLFIQDEYEGTEHAKYWIKQLGINCVYTCVPDKYIDAVYPESEFPFVKFINTLTGFVPEHCPDVSSYKSPADREILIGYRGRMLPFWYGSLGFEKYQIGAEMKKLCSQRGLNVDIENDSDKRIYGKGWYHFLGSCRATLGTESGANIFDGDGSIRLKLTRLIEQNSNLKFEEIYEEHIRPHEKIMMNQISPKLFEAIALKTALILFEGEYSGILTPNEHYIPLRKDFSNLDKVLSQIEDNDYIKMLTEKAYEDIIRSKKYSYENFIAGFDNCLANVNRKSQRIKTQLYMNIGFQSENDLYLRFHFKNLLTFPGKRIFNLNELQGKEGERIYLDQTIHVLCKQWWEVTYQIGLTIIDSTLMLMSKLIPGGFKYALAKVIPRSIKEELKLRLNKVQ